MAETLFGIHGKALELRSQRMGLLTSNIANAVAYSGTLNFLRGRIETITRAIKGE